MGLTRESRQRGEVIRICFSGPRNDQAGGGHPRVPLVSLRDSLHAPFRASGFEILETRRMNRCFGNVRLRVLRLKEVLVAAGGTTILQRRHFAGEKGTCCIAPSGYIAGCGWRLQRGSREAMVYLCGVQQSQAHPPPACHERSGPRGRRLGVSQSRNLLRACSSAEMVAYRVSARMNNSANDSSACIALLA